MRPIDADALKEAFYERGLGYQAIDELINEAPIIDAVPVVRCKDCVNGNMDRGFFLCCSSGMVVNEDDFCSYGERKD